MSLAAKRAKKNGLKFKLDLKIDPTKTNKVLMSDIDNYNKMTNASDGLGDAEDHGAEHYFSSSYVKNKENKSMNGGRRTRKFRRKLRRKTNRKKRKSRRTSKRRTNRRTNRRTKRRGGGQKERNTRALQKALTTISTKCNISMVHMGPITLTDAGLMYGQRSATMDIHGQVTDGSLTTKGAQIIDYANGLNSNRYGCEAVKEALTKAPFNFQ